MKAMKKFKVIEESRFLKKQDMQNLIGGDCAPVTSICNVGNPHESCGILHIKYEYCGPGFAPEGYNNGPGGESCVGSNIEYKTSNCGGLSWFSTKCGNNGEIYIV